MKYWIQIILKGLLYFVKTVWIGYQIFLGALLVTSLVILLWVADYFHWSEIRGLRKKNPGTTSFMEMERQRILNDSVLLGKVTGEGTDKDKRDIIWREWLPLASMPSLAKDITIVAEDGKFYQHQGFDLEQIEYAIVSNRQKGKQSRGASTISQQVVKNLFLKGEKKYSRKVKEAIMTVLLEHYLTKERILEIYLNIAQFGHGIFGIQAGAKHHFHKAVDELGFDEIVSLIAIVPSPIRWHPRTGSGAYHRHRKRICRNLALYKSIRKKIPDDEYQAFIMYASEEEALRWSQLRDRERNDSVLGRIDSTKTTEPSNNNDPEGVTTEEH
ncbi:monofunctional biosynthetic peptidoglycan transglycosylase [Fibrobacterota bacterium]